MDSIACGRARFTPLSEARGTHAAFLVVWIPSPSFVSESVVVWKQFLFWKNSVHFS